MRPRLRTRPRAGSTGRLEGIGRPGESEFARQAANTQAIEGAIACKRFYCNGTFDFHYDLSFGKPRELPPVKILSWAEQ